LAAFAAGSMVGWPLYYLGNGLHQRGGRLPDMRPMRVSVCATSAAALLLGFFLVPLPISGVRQTALVEVRPEALEKVFVPVPAILERLHMRNGQRVAKGDILAEFSSLELENQLAETLTQHDIHEVQLQELRAQADETSDAQERAKLQVALATTGGQCQRYRRQAEVYTKMRRRLVLQAPRPGVVMGLPRKDEVGKLWEKDQATPFCSIGDPRRLRAVMPVTPADYHLLREDLAAARRWGDDLAVTIRVRGLGSDRWQGKVATLPESDAKEVPLSLTTQAGGPLAARTGSRPQIFVPQSQNYLVAVEFLEQDPSICPGTLAHVKIHCRWRSTAWWVWRSASSAFDLGLL
ncbi:MAG TPA: biotin/lipoyl-binding protein, partial [Gemmataceae bacterium]|nr:biotin/lipoyl-binding protein [Gemmataceae bacterium]